MSHATLEAVTKRIEKRSVKSRQRYLDAMKHIGERSPQRNVLSCGNLAHGFAACGAGDKEKLKGATANIGIVSAYNDMLSAHNPYYDYPEKLKAYAHDAGAVAQVAGGVPAMCDGVTQGQLGMELSLFSRDVIAMSTAVALSHNMFDAALCLGICDKIVPGLFIGASQFGYLPVAFVPAGPMPSGLPNNEKQRIREQYAKGEIGKEELLEAESASYHSPGTCTFYGTANSNQMLLEIMGLQLPGSSFVNPTDPLREALNRHAVETVLSHTAASDQYVSMCDVVTEKSLVNAIVGLLATGGSTNHTIHLIAMGKAVGIHIDWSDMAELSAVVPLLCRIYPNGQADVNHFHEAGGVPFIIRELLDAGLLHEDVTTILGGDLRGFTQLPALHEGNAMWSAAPEASRLPEVVSTVKAPFKEEGGICLVGGNLGRAIVKTSALNEDQLSIKAPAKVFTSQEALQAAFDAGNLSGDFVAVVTGQGPRANGMPELHKLTPSLGVLQKLGFKVALVTDGRMSGASGKVLAAIHVSPECQQGGALGKVRDGDLIEVNALTGTLNAHVEAEIWEAREVNPVAQDAQPYALGRNLFAKARSIATSAEEGGSFLGLAEEL